MIFAFASYHGNTLVRYPHLAGAHPRWTTAIPGGFTIENRLFREFRGRAPAVSSPRELASSSEESPITSASGQAGGWAECLVSRRGESGLTAIHPLRRLRRRRSDPSRPSVLAVEAGQLTWHTARNNGGLSHQEANHARANQLHHHRAVGAGDQTTAWEPRRTHRVKATAQAAGGLGNPHTPSARGPAARPRFVRRGDRQQVSRQ